MRQLHLQLYLLCCSRSCLTSRGWSALRTLLSHGVMLGMEQAKRAANVRYFSNRQKGKRKRASPMQLASLRLGDLARVFRSRYGAVRLPDDDAGRDDIRLADRKSTRLISSHVSISYAVFCLKKKK